MEQGEQRLCGEESRCIWSMSRTQIHEFLESVAENGATKALERVGLGDDSAASDVRDLRSLAGNIRDARRAVWAQLGRVLALVIMIGVGSLFMKKPTTEEVMKWFGG